MNTFEKVKTVRRLTEAKSLEFNPETATRILGKAYKPVYGNPNVRELEKKGGFASKSVTNKFNNILAKYGFKPVKMDNKATQVDTVSGYALYKNKDGVKAEQSSYLGQRSSQNTHSFKFDFTGSKAEVDQKTVKDNPKKYGL